MTTENKTQDNLSDLRNRLIKSTAVNSLLQESKIYNLFKTLGWKVEHSPYYLDAETGKFREVDITARKYWSKKKSEEFSFGVNFIIECKSISNYQIIVSSELDYQAGCNLENNWIGDDSTDNYPKTIDLLKKHNIKNKDIQLTLRTFHKFLFPNGLIRYIDYRLDSFDIPVFNAFRETNIGTTKELENSVVWKASQSLNSCIQAHKSMVWEDIDYELYNIENEEFLSTYEDKLSELRQTLISSATHFEYLHPVLVVESNLWELSQGKLNELKYFRFVFQRLFDHEIWIDVVSFDHLAEYLEKTKKYDDFFIGKGFKNK